MPALITHHLFGEEAASKMPKGILDDQECLLAFLLGNQGPDPLFFCFSELPAAARKMRQLGSDMHKRNPYPSFMALRDAVERLHPKDALIGRAFALGFLGHYILDSTTHPFIYAQQDALIAANGSLTDAAGEVHAIIESDIDSWMLWSLRNLTIEDISCVGNLLRTQRIDRVAGALVSQVAWQVFGTSINAEEYAGCVADYDFVMRAIEPAGSRNERIISSIERLVRPHSQLGALAHRITTSEDCPAANLERATWTNPHTGQQSDESFGDLFYNALDRWPQTAEAFIRADVDALKEILTANFDGKPQGQPDQE